jgi:hypothetical protein
MRLVAFAVLTVALVAYVGLALVVWVAQERLIFAAPLARGLPSVVGAEVWRLEAPAGPLPALYLEASPGAPTVVHFHGNAEELADLVGAFQELRAQGLGVLGVEYPGYGGAAGTPSERSILEAAELALGRLRTRGVAPERTVLEGQSLGTGVAAEMARRGHGAKLLLLSPFTSMVEMARLQVPWLPVSLLLRHRFDTALKAPELSLPVLILHGTRDDVVPVAMGKRLSTLFPNARLELIEGADHGGLLAARARPMAERIARFAREP